MEAIPEAAPASQAEVILSARRPWGVRVARWVSYTLSPPVVGAIALVLVSQLAGASSAWRWSAAYLLLAVALPTLYVGWLVRSGKVADFELSRREQRTRPFLATLGCMTAGWLLVRIGHGPALLAALAAAATAQAAILLAITMRWKISIHAASIGAFSVLLVAALGAGATPALLLVPLVAWARVRLRRHTTAQVLAGAALGMASMLLALWLSA